MNKKKSYKHIVFICLIIVALIYLFFKPTVIIPQPAEISCCEDIVVMMDKAEQLSPIVKSDVEIGLVDMPKTKNVLGIDIQEKYVIRDFEYIITYSSSDTSVAIIDESGLITPVSTGEAEIIVQSGEITKEIKCTVKEYVSPKSMPEEIEVLIDETVNTVDELTKYQVLKAEFAIENENVAKVSENGIVTGINHGQTILSTVLASGETAITTIKVLQPVYDIEVLDKSVNVGNTVNIGAKLLPEGCDYGTNLTYTSSDTSVATVSASGIITGKSAGTATITVKSENGVERTLTVTVKKVAAPVQITGSSSSASSSSSGGSSSSSSSSTSGSSGSTATPTGLSSFQIAQIVSAGSAALKAKDRYWGECNSYGYDDNVGTNGMTYDQAYNRVMTKVNAIYPGAMVGRVFANGSTIIVASTTTF